jgi:hypothetical protein
MSEMKAENRKATRKKVKFTDSIFFIIVIMMFLYVGVCSSLVKLVVMLIDPLLVNGGVSEALIFIIENYLVRIIPFIGIILFTGLVKGNRFIYNSFAMKYENNGFKALFLGSLIGFFMNGVCVLAAVIHGDSMHYSHGRTDLYDVVVPQGFTAGREPMGAESEGRVKDRICERKSKIVKKTFR